MKKPYADDAGSTAEKIVWGRVGTATDIEAVEPGSPQHGPARENEVRASKKQVRNPGVYVAHQLMVKQREMITIEFEQYYISKGLPIEVELSGPDKTYISLLSPLFCKNSVDRLVERTNLFSYLKEAGFRKATIGDINEEIWAYDLRAL